MDKIFIVEDDEAIVKSIKLALKDEFSVRSVSNFRAVKQEILEFEADLVLMDIGLPFYSGFYWTTELRKITHLPIIFISSSSDDMNQITAMNQGADDFVTKPFSLSLLRAKIKALLRRSYAFAGSEKLDFLEFSLSENIVSTDKQQIELTTSENKILMLLFRKKGEVVSKESILQELWQTDEFIDVNTLNVKMTRLRKKVSEIGLDQHIVTKRGAGYVLA
ncbi:MULTISPECIES: response regulator transcription factor [unclassified Lactococcus]|uniref:response regulator transcription factor n=1 Tax=unclassified Lactococcus TaxID=2643510 RepID=UPI0011CBAD68|nr:MULTISPECIES: response regulator transcription factor [unclassified Lactococcus]MQW22164.1 response regulator [Lactococcus sp. dk101]TXK45099.1 response regulator transcription factor [Lactococcus sp. dk310]TXK51121.1 response regulator transcription factor [Lactococcus sp. dk322]